MVLFDLGSVLFFAGAVVGLGERLFDKEPNVSYLLGGFGLFAGAIGIVLGLFVDWIQFSKLLTTIVVFVIWVAAVPEEDESGASGDDSGSTSSTTSADSFETGDNVDRGSAPPTTRNAAEPRESTAVFDPVESTAREESGDTKVFSGRDDR